MYILIYLYHIWSLNLWRIGGDLLRLSNQVRSADVRRILSLLRGSKPAPSFVFLFLKSVRVRKKVRWNWCHIYAWWIKNTRVFSNDGSVNKQTKDTTVCPLCQMSSTNLSFRLENAFKTIENEIYGVVEREESFETFLLFSPSFLFSFLSSFFLSNPTSFLSF